MTQLSKQLAFISSPKSFMEQENIENKINKSLFVCICLHPYFKTAMSHTQMDLRATVCALLRLKWK